MKKQSYDSGSNVLFSKVSIAARWENYLKTIDMKEIQAARDAYLGSNAEEGDLAREFVTGKGSLTHLLNTIPFMRVEDEDRTIEKLRYHKENGKIPNLSIKCLRK